MATTPSITELMSQMQQNLDAINYHLARIEDTKAHDDEIERLELERQKRADTLSLQLAQEFKELEAKKKKLGKPAEEKRRRETEERAERRKREERELAIQRRKEDAEIVARRMREDAVRKARLEQEEEELKVKVLEEEEQIKALLAGDGEKKRREATERENSLYEDFEAKMIQLEDEMEKKVVESTKILAELDEKRKAISAQIDATMKTSARRTPSFRRGSKRYSITGLAADVAAILGGKPGLERRSTQSSLAQIDEQNGPPHTEIPRDIPTPARSDATPSSRMSYAGSIRSLESKSEDADDIRAREEMDRINAEIMAEMEAERAGTPPKRTEAPRSLHRASSMSTSNASIRSSISPSNASIRSSKLEDPEDVRAREEMARINAEIMAAAAAEQQEQRLSRQIYTPPSPPVNSHQRRPTWFDQAKLAVVQGAHGVLKFKTEGADMEIVKSPKEIEHPRELQSAKSVEPFIYEGPKHARLPTWVDQATLPVVFGSHGILKFKNDGADMEVVVSPKSIDPPRPQQQSTRSLEPFTYSGPKHARLPTWADQATLPVVTGSHGLLKFGDGGASMAVVERPQETQTFSRHEHLPTWADQSKLDLVSGSWGRLSFREGGADMVIVEAPKPRSVPDITQPKLSPTWTDQSTLPVLKGTHCRLSFSESGADMKVLQPTIIPEAAWFGKRASITSQPQHRMLSPYITSAMPGNVKAREQEIKQKRLSIANGLGSATMNHGRDNTRSVPREIVGQETVVVAEVGGEKYDLNHPALKKIIQAVAVPVKGSYWGADQGRLHVVRGSHGALVFGNSGAELKSAMPRRGEAYWEANQSTLPLVRGSHGFLTFSSMGSVMKVRRSDPYWTNQHTLSMLRGDHGFLSFGEFETVMKVRKMDPYWADQRTLAIVKGSHGRLAFGSNGEARMEVVRPDPYWADQSSISLVRGSHGRLAFGPDGASLRVVRPDPYWADQRTLFLVKGSHGRLAFSSNGTSSLEIIRPDPYWSADQRSLSLARGSHGVLSFGSEGAWMLVRPDPYWVDQSTLSVVQGSYGRLSFGPDGAFLEIVRPDPYWSVDQRTVPLVRGSNGRLAFTSNGASLEVVRPDPYWTANQTILDIVTGMHATLKFTAGGASMEIPLSNRTYWAANQAELKVVKGPHGSLRFDGSEAVLDVVGQERPYWGADQTGLKVMRGSHGSLRFTEGGASVHVIGQKRTYWEADQASLKVVRGSHGTLHFTAEGTMVDIVKPRNPYWVANQRSLKIVWGSHARLHFAGGEAIVDGIKPSSLYWNANQTSLRILQGSHGHLNFRDEEATIHAAQPKTSYWLANQALLPMIRGAHGIMSFNGTEAFVKVQSLPIPYWTANQAKLDEIRGSHGTVQFTTEGATIQAHSPADSKTTSRHPFATQAAYWADQAKLSKIQGNHARLSFNNSISSAVPHTTPQDNWNSPPTLETGGFFPDSDSEPEEDRPILSKRTSFGPGAFASILNKVKDRVPIVTNLVGNGSYSSFSHDEESPITPTDSTPSLLTNTDGQSIDEPVIHTSPESSHPHHQSAHFHDNPVTAIYEEEREVKLSPLPTEVEFQFDPVYGQPIPLAPRAKSPLLNRAPISTKPFESVTRGLASNNPFRTGVSRIPVRTASVTARSDRNEGMIERRRALFESGGK